MMAKRKLGPWEVSALGFGAMPLSFGKGDGVLQSNPDATVHAALDAGITFIDTADIYAPSWDEMGHNERIVAAALKSYDGDISNVVVATKGGITRSEGEQWGRNGTLGYLRRRAEAALTALEIDQLDLFYLHRPDRTIVYSESMEALRQLVDDGLIRTAGISNASVEEIDIAVDVLGERLVAVQNEFSPRFHHTSKPELDHCGELGIAFVPFSPLGGGAHVESLAERFPSIQRAAEELGISPQRVTLAWELSLGEHVIPIPGASRPESIRDSSKALTDEVPTELLQAINKEVL